MTIRLLLLGSLATVLCGCFGSLLESKQPVDTIYVLAPPQPVTSPRPVAVDLSISLPRLAPGLESSRIAVLKGRELNYYTGARWGAELSQLIQSFLVQTVTGQGSFRSVASADVRVTSDYVLAIEVTHFEAEYAQADAPRAHVTFIGRLMKVNDRVLVDTLVADASVAAAENRMSAVIAAFEQAAQQAGTQLGEQAAAAAQGDATRQATVP